MEKEEEEEKEAEIEKREKEGNRERKKIDKLKKKTEDGGAGEAEDGRKCCQMQVSIFISSDIRWTSRCSQTSTDFRFLKTALPQCG